MSQASEWTNQAQRILTSGIRPHFAPTSLELNTYRSHLQKVVSVFSHPTVLILGATPELADLALGSGCRLFRVDYNPAMIEAGRHREQIKKRSNEAILHCNWLDMGPVSDDSIDLVLGDVAINQIKHENMNSLFHELRRVTHSSSFFSLKQIILPDDESPAYTFEEALASYKDNEITLEELYLILRFNCFLKEAYNREKFILDADKVFSAIEKLHLPGATETVFFELMASRRGKLKHTVYRRRKQYELFEKNLGKCRVDTPENSFVYENIYNMYFIEKSL